MPGTSRPRRLAVAALTVALVLGLSACASDYPNTTFVTFSEFGRDIDALWDKLLFWGTIVFVLVEAILIYTLIRYRSRPGQPEPKHVHGNTTLEIAWTLLPAVILVFIAIPTVRTIFRTQAPAVPDALQVEVVGHQWWWEIRYPDAQVTTANRLHLPVGQPVDVHVSSADVIHSFWVPRLGGKVDAIPGITNVIRLYADRPGVFRGQCAEFCGARHARMILSVEAQASTAFDAWLNARRRLRHE